MSRKRSLGTILLLLLPAAPAAADNHFLLELSGGLATPLGDTEADTEGGGAFATTFGIGGRFKGFAPALYLVGRVGYANVQQVGPERFGSAVIERDDVEWSLGGRVYLPIFERLRVVLQVTAGRVVETAEVSREGHAMLSVEDERFALFGTTGLQLRVSDHFSLGAGADLGWLYSDDRTDLAAVAAGLGDDGDGRGLLRLGVTTTFHF